MGETAILTSDKFLLSVALVLQRPKDNSLIFFNTLASIIKEKEYRLPMEAHQRQTFSLAGREKRDVVLIESNLCNFIAFISSGNVAVELKDNTLTGFGSPGFGGGRFGGQGLGNVMSTINGLFIAEGQFTNLTLENLTDVIIYVDLLAVKLEN